ncbi:COG4315 family predicted lipoprotein [Rhizobacter sp. P5_C2]
MIQRTLIGAALAAVTLAALAHVEPPLKVVDGVAANAAGMTVYTFDKDVAGSGKSTCNGGCAALWPPVPAPTEARADQVVTRDDGSRQLAHHGKPVYLYAADTKPGDRTGDKFKDVWHVITP